MSSTSFEVHQPGADRDVAFETARQEAAHDFGWHEYSGTVATKKEVTTVHESTLALTNARALANRLLDERDGIYCDRYDDYAAAIPVADTDGGPRTGWLFFGVASC